MKENTKAMVLASFVADSLALGAHWIYNTQRIQEQFGRVESFLKPASESYHSTKDKGEFTHYGDQTLILLESVAAHNGFDLHDLSARWRAFFADYDGYVDQATRVTLSRYDSGKGPEEAGSPSDDLAGAARVAPIIYCYSDDCPAAINASRSQTKMTHNNPIAIASADFFSRVAWDVLHGHSPTAAMETISREHLKDSPLANWVKRGLESKEENSLVAIFQFGQSCHTQEAFPGVVHLIVKYEDNLKEALIQSVMAGGDSAARGMMVGMVLGAHLGLGSLPEAWLSQLKKKDQIVELLQRIR